MKAGVRRRAGIDGSRRSWFARADSKNPTDNHIWTCVFPPKKNDLNFASMASISIFAGVSERGVERFALGIKLARSKKY